LPIPNDSVIFGFKALTFGTLEPGNGVPFGPDPKGPAPSSLEGKEVPNAPMRIIWHQFGFIDARFTLLTSNTSVSIVVG
jgi:hypothetical protein